LRNQLGPAVVEQGDQIFSDRTYVRGALTLYALRLEVGQTMFRRILRTFFRMYDGRNVRSADFVRAAAKISRDPDVPGLLQDWLYGQALPPLPGAAGAGARAEGLSGPVGPMPDLVGLRCAGGAHRSGKPVACR
jgi:hypothetical protein